MKYLLLSIIIFIGLLLPQPTLAASFETEPKEFFLKTNIASRLENKLLIRNLTSQTKSFTLTWLGYQLPKEEVVDTLLVTKHSIDFASINPKSLLLEPFGTDIVTIDLAPPDEILPGDYYGTVLVSSGEQSEKVDLAARVLGAAEEKLSVSKIESTNKTLSVLVSNKGNQTSNFTLTLEVKKLFGPTKKLQLENLVLRSGQQKTFSFTKPSLSPGFYQIYPTLIYADKSFPSAEHISFWSRGWLFLAAVLLALILISFALFKLRKKWSKS